jgi:threonine/homoserine/homoserine lactone efflux protein
VTHAWLAGLAAGYGIAIPVGAIAVLIVSVAARSSFWVGAVGGLGAATADLCYAGVAATTGYALSPVLHQVSGPLRFVGAIVLGTVAVRGLRAAWRARTAGVSAETHTPLQLRYTYLGFLGMTLLNPLTVLYFAALVIAGQAPVAGAATACAFVVGVFLASLSWQILLAGTGAAMHRTGLGASRLWTGLVANALICAFAVQLVLTA